MYTKTLHDIKATLCFLKEEGNALSLSLTEEFPADIVNALSEFFPDGHAEKKAYTYAVSYDGVEIARLFFACEKERAVSLGTPVKYMLERLYEQSRSAHSEATEGDVYKKALQFIKANYTEGITVADVARHTGYSESYFGYAFKKKYKMSVSLYVRELQLAKAKDLLLDTAFAISAVASYVGFDDSNYFTAIFKKHFGISPKEFRKKYGRFVEF